MEHAENSAECAEKTGDRSQLFHCVHLAPLKHSQIRLKIRGRSYFRKVGPKIKSDQSMLPMTTIATGLLPVPKVGVDIGVKSPVAWLMTYPDTVLLSRLTT